MPGAQASMPPPAPAALWPLPGACRSELLTLWFEPRVVLKVEPVLLGSLPGRLHAGCSGACMLPSPDALDCPDVRRRELRSVMFQRFGDKPVS
eukprot:363712-Chlamydomonas_euryale.AAC.17